jgi:(1->4)-alpha-D-glucan 1-alpha-D-glucosylmutase
MAQARFADRLVVFTRRCEREALFVVVPRLTASLGCPPIGLVWEDTAVTLPSFAEGEWRDVLTGREWRAGDPIPVAELLSDLPLSILAATR